MDIATVLTGYFVIGVFACVGFLGLAMANIADISRR